MASRIAECISSALVGSCITNSGRRVLYSGLLTDSPLQLHRTAIGVHPIPQLQGLEVAIQPPLAPVQLHMLVCVVVARGAQDRRAADAVAVQAVDNRRPTADVASGLCIRYCGTLDALLEGPGLEGCPCCGILLLPKGMLAGGWGGPLATIGTCRHLLIASHGPRQGGIQPIHLQ